MSSTATLMPSDTQDGHSAVSNQPEAGSTITQTVQEDPALGYSDRQSPLTERGTEAGQGFDFTELESADVNVFSPPRSDELRDIGEASFGTPPPATEDVIGADNRTIVPDTTLYPWRVMCSLLITAADNSTWVGTGWFISARTLITAGHCVHIKGSSVP